jgi:phosphoglycolate phosphatase-like HAD superfamily hydrolase
VKLSPKLIIFDVDGVLVDVHGSFHKSIVDTVHYFTGSGASLTPKSTSGKIAPATTMTGD